MIPFLDVSSHQDPIDWPTCAAYLLGQNAESGCIVKVSEGTDYINTALRQQRQGAHAAGLKNVGLYHFARPSKNSGSAEADYFIAAYGNEHGLDTNEFLCLDLEDTDVPATADLDAYVLDFSDRIFNALGIRPIVYSGSWYTEPHNLTRDPKLAQNGLWWAAPGSTLPTTPEPWKSAGKGILLWQWNWNGTLPGINGPVDLDWLVGEIETLRPYQWGYSQPLPPATDVADLPMDTDLPTILSHIQAISTQSVVRADAALARTKLGLVT